MECLQLSKLYVDEIAPKTAGTYPVISEMPLPVFCASHSGAMSLSNVVLTSANSYDTVRVNQGNHMNLSTGEFTCPVDGIYRIAARMTSTNVTTNVRLQKNGSTLAEVYSDGVGSNYSVSGEAVTECVAGDTLRIQVASCNTLGGAQHKNFTFYLMR